jgi:hypothetical protein
MTLECRTLLANFIVSSADDGESTGTLRWAIGQANANSQADTISFSSLFNTPQTIALTLGPLALTDPATTTISGPGANLLTVSGGGGASRVFDIDGASAAISGLTVTGGSADRGAGVRNDGGTLTLSAVEISNNTATDSGGGLASQFGATTTLVGCTLSGNTAGNGGGGLLNASSTTSLTNSTVTGNSVTATTGSGGGLANTSGTITLLNVTVSANAASTAGGVSSAGGTLNVTNTIVAANTGGDLSGTPSGSHNIIGGSPLLAALGDYGGSTLTMAPMPGSPAIGGGATSTGIPATDQRGQARSGLVDIGAFQTQSVILVNTTIDGLGSGAGQISLRQAINLANALSSADTIAFDATLFATPQTITLSAGQFTLMDKEKTTINGPGESVLTVSGGGTSRVFELDHGLAAISGLTITGGSATTGGGIWNNGGTLELTQATVTGNSAANAGAGVETDSGTTSLTNVTVSQNTASNDVSIAVGGGLENITGTTTVTGGSFDGNKADLGGGFYNGGGGTLTLIGVTVSGNSGFASGAGVENKGGTLSMTGDTLSGNTAELSGGGLDNSNGTATLTGCTLSGNTAQIGAGLHTSGTLTTLTNSTLNGNTASQSGGGLLADAGTASFINCTVSGNSALVCGGLFNYENGATLTLTNTIAAGNQNSDISGNYSGDHNLIGVDPLLSALGDYGGPTMTMVPLPGSPAQGGGATGPGIPTTDQRGQPRPASVDIGAFQGEGTALVVNTTVDGVGSGSGQISLRQAINLANVEPTADTISFDPTVFQTPQTITLAGTQLELANRTASMTITGPGAGVTVSGGGKSRVFEVDAGVTALISGLTITGGLAQSGAGVHNLGGTLSMNDCNLSGNTSTAGGGGLGGVGTLTMINCTVSGNFAPGDGGGLNIYGGTASLTNVTVSGNSSSEFDGGGLATFDCAVTLINSTVSGNSAGRHGGGLFNNGSATSVTLINCTVNGNSAAAGGGIYNLGGPPALLTDTIVAANSAATKADVSGALVSSSANNLVGNGSGMSGISNGGNGNQVGTSQAPIDPLLSSLGNYGGPTQTVALLPGSPAIGAGATGTGIPTTDQRGQQRSGHVDIGAFQSGGFNIVLFASSTPQSAVIGKMFGNPLAVMVTAKNPVEPVDGGAVSFTAAQVGGSSANLSSATGTVVGGVAEVSATANNVPGMYTVTATAAGVGFSVSFALTNTEFPSLVVNTTQDVVNSIDGTTSLREAIDFALTLATASTITFSPAVFGSAPQTIVLTLGQLTLFASANITIVGPGAGLLTVSGGGASRVFDIDDAQAAISGLTITGGIADRGAGIRNQIGTLTLTNCTITGNGSLAATSVGGGVYSIFGTTSITNCTVTGNKALKIGGGVYSVGGTVTLTGCSVSANSSASGGGVAVCAATGTLTNCTIANNTAAKAGGVFVSSDATVTVSSSSLIGNTAENAGGGGAANFNGNATFTNCTFSGNSAGTGNGGGMLADGSTMLINCTISGNSAGAGGGVDIYSGVSATLINTIVAGQASGGDIAGAPQPDSANNLVGGNPLLAPLGDYGGPTSTMAPLSGSNAIGGGTTGGGVPSTDQRGFVRGASVDIGAFQSQGTTLVVNVASDGVGSGPGQLSLRQAVNLANAQTTGDSISFDPSVFATPQTITLTAGPLSLTDAARTTIAGPGPSLLTISGGATSRVFDIPGGSAALSGMTISGGHGDNGGGLRNAGGTLSLTNVSVSGNFASHNGGGLYTAPGGSTTISGVTFSNNSASVGAGVAVGSSAVDTLSNCTISGNTALSNGGGVASLGGTLSLTNVTVSNNQAGPPNGTGGGGLYISGSGTATLRNTIVAGNQSGDIAGSLQPASANNLIGGNPLLAPLGNYGGPTPTMPLLPGSSAINGGSAGIGVPTTDQRGVTRVGRVDIGAFESQGFIITTVPGSTPQSVQAGTPFKNLLAVAVTASNPIEPVNGGVVSFLATPGQGASATLSSPTAIIADGRAAVSAIANGRPGTYSVGASATGAVATSFLLSNIEIPGLRVTTSSDVVNAFDGLTSLREAIAYANSHPGPDVITFAPSAFGRRPRTITLKAGSLMLTDPSTTTIVGPGARLLKIDGARKSRVFEVRRGSLDLSGLTITGGRSRNGGGLRNDGGRISLTGVILRGNPARGKGGGLLNEGSATLKNVRVTGNSARRGSGVANLGTLPLKSATSRGNFARVARDLFNSLTARLIR